MQKNLWVVIISSFFLVKMSALALGSGYPIPNSSDCSIVSNNADLNALASQLQSEFLLKDYKKVIELSQYIFNKYSDNARQMESTLKDFAWETKDKIFGYDSLNLVSLALYLQTLSYVQLADTNKASESGALLLDTFYFGQCANQDLSFAKPSFDLQEDVSMFKNYDFKKSAIK